MARSASSLKSTEKTTWKHWRQLVSTISRWNALPLLHSAIGPGFVPPSSVWLFLIDSKVLIKLSSRRRITRTICVETTKIDGNSSFSAKSSCHFESRSSLHVSDLAALTIPKYHLQVHVYVYIKINATNSDDAWFQLKEIQRFPVLTTSWLLLPKYYKEKDIHKFPSLANSYPCSQYSQTSWFKKLYSQKVTGIQKSNLLFWIRPLNVHKIYMYTKCEYFLPTCSYPHKSRPYTVWCRVLSCRRSQSDYPVWTEPGTGLALLGEPSLHQE